MGNHDSIHFLNCAAKTQQERAATYDVGGKFGGERSMGKTVQAFNIITGRDLSESEGWLLLQVLKDVRDRTNGPHYDSLLDGVAYSSLKAEARMAEVPQQPTEGQPAVATAKGEAVNPVEPDLARCGIPAGWIEWDGIIEWDLVKDVAMVRVSGIWAFCKKIKPNDPLDSGLIIIPGQDAGEALMGVECWVWGFAAGGTKEFPLARVIGEFHDGRYFAYGLMGGSGWEHARPTYLGRPE